MTLWLYRAQISLAEGLSTLSSQERDEDAAVEMVKHLARTAARMDVALCKGKNNAREGFDVKMSNASIG